MLECLGVDFTMNNETESGIISNKYMPQFEGMIKTNITDLLDVYYIANGLFIDKELYKDEEILYELIKNDSFDNLGDRLSYLKILNDENFLKRILELDEYNKRYEENNHHKSIVAEEEGEEPREDATNNDDGWASFADDIEISDDDLTF